MWGGSMVKGLAFESRSENGVQTPAWQFTNHGGAKKSPENLAET
jgi:hypothetical protein